VEDRLRRPSRGRWRRRRGLTDMALYEYQCKRCGRKVEVIQSFSDPPPAKCLHCGGTLAKLLSSPAFQFKGSGFYATDYGRSGGKPEDSSKGKQADGGATSEAGAETKGDSAGQSAKDSGDSSREKKDSKDSSKEKGDSGPGAAKEAAHGGTSAAPSKKNKSAKD
jgi:putative FmdB family regulatory protein